VTQAHRYSWVENWSEEHQRPFYYNQVSVVAVQQLLQGSLVHQSS
jgi:hypothetical protein